MRTFVVALGLSASLLACTDTPEFRDHGGIKVQAGSIDNTWCGATAQNCPGDGFPCSTYCSEQHTEFHEKANWYFDSCN